MYRFLLVLCLVAAARSVQAAVVFDGTSPYHHIRVIDQNGLRTLSFDGSAETRMTLADPSKGHFQYTEYFHMPWLWNTNITNVLMIGLGGASTQRAYQRHYPEVRLETAELDAMVVKVAREFFQFQDGPSNKVAVTDGRVYLRQAEKKYDVIILDAYTKNRYGSFIPHHLATSEFFKLADQRLADNGVLAYNVMGSLQGWRADIVGAVYRTLKTVFPQVYLFPATDSLNVVLIATKAREPMTPIIAGRRAAELNALGVKTPPSFQGFARALRTAPPSSFLRSPVLTDDFAPVDGLLRGAR